MHLHPARSVHILLPGRRSALENDPLKNHNPGIDVIIAANVIQNEAVELFKDYLVFATRLSKNSFVGVNQSKQTGKTGPDTADRLFNLIKKRY